MHIIREVVAEPERPVLPFPADRDSIVLHRLAEKAFRPLHHGHQNCCQSPHSCPSAALGRGGHRANG
ncbi:hypothetical protein BST45_15845 [Mycobacterium shinjukuense]|nr:hypothetical protein BST45_15845 [Mycobacterium shinjukuense]